MKVIIAGSRTIVDYDLVLKAVKEARFRITEVVCGKARGVDTLGEEFAKRNNISIKYFPADWSIGKKAGILRNIQMGDYADCLIAIMYKEGTTGTQHMINYMKSLGKPVFILLI